MLPPRCSACGALLLTYSRSCSSCGLSEMQARIAKALHQPREKRAPSKPVRRHRPNS